MGSSSSRSASFGHSHDSQRSHDSSASPYESIEDRRTLYYADQPPRWRRKHFLSANKSLAGRIAKHRKAAAVAGGGKSPAPATSSSSRMCRRRRKSYQKRKASDSGRGSDECDCGSGGGDKASSDEEGDESLVSCRYCDEEEEEELRNLKGEAEKKFVLSWSLRIEANLGFRYFLMQ